MQFRTEAWNLNEVLI